MKIWFLVSGSLFLAPGFRRSFPFRRVLFAPRIGYLLVPLESVLQSAPVRDLRWHQAVSKSEKADLKVLITCAGWQCPCSSGVVCLSTVAEKFLYRRALRNSLTCKFYWQQLSGELLP